jgi:hypothetical protein
MESIPLLSSIKYNKLTQLGLNKKLRPVPTQKKSKKIEICAVYNMPRVSGLKKSIWTELV